MAYGELMQHSGTHFANGVSLTGAGPAPYRELPAPDRELPAPVRELPAPDQELDRELEPGAEITPLKQPDA